MAVHHVQERDNSKNFAFKCHRENQDIYAVNCITFHPTYGTFATTGSDGTYNFWDKVCQAASHPSGASSERAGGAWGNPLFSAAPPYPSPSLPRARPLHRSLLDHVPERPLPSYPSLSLNAPYPRIHPSRLTPLTLGSIPLA